MELKIDHLNKRFKDKTAVNDVSLTLTSGVWGLLGANGAGKTTLMRMIADIMTPTSGAIYYDGTDIRKMGEEYRNIFGFLPQDFGYHHDFTVKDYLEYMAALKDIPAKAATRKINSLLDVLSLSDVKKKKISNLSGGMKRRVGIAQAMVAKYPDLERGESASKTGRTHIPPRIYKEIYHLQQEQEEIVSSIEKVNHFNAKKQSTEVINMINSFIPKAERMKTELEKYRKEYEKMKEEYARMEAQQREISSEKRENYFRALHAEAEVSHLQKMLDRIPPEVAKMYQPKKSIERER